MSSLENPETEGMEPSNEPQEEDVYHCQYCDATFPKTREGALQKGQHTIREHSDRVKQERAIGLRPQTSRQAAAVALSDPEKELLQEMQPREYVAQYGELGIAKLRRARLAKLIEIAPDITAKVRTWVMENYDSDEMAQKDPNALQAVLEHSGVSQRTSQRITAIIAAREGELRSYLPIPQPYYGQQPSPYPANQFPYSGSSPGDQRVYVRQNPPPYYPYAQPGYYPPPPPEPISRSAAGPALTAQDVAKVVQTELDKKNEKDKLTLLADGMTGVLDEMKDLKAKVESGEIGGKKEEPWEKAFKTTQEQIKSLTESLTEKNKSAKTDQDREEIKALRDQIMKLNQDLTSKEQERRMAEFEGRLMGEMKDLKGLVQTSGGSGRVVEGYKSDEFRLLGQGLEHAVKKEPVRIIIEGAERLMGAPAPPRKTVEQGTELDSLLSPEMSVDK